MEPGLFFGFGMLHEFFAHDLFLEKRLPRGEAGIQAGNSDLE